MSIADLMHTVVEGGTTSMVLLAALPFVLGLVAWALAKNRQERASQLVANASIALGLMALLVLLCTIIWGASHDLSVIEDIAIPWLVLPPFMVVAAFFVEHWVHPGKQESIRAQIRGALLIVIVLAVLYWLLSTMRVWMMVHTGVLGLIMFIAALIGILYFLVRKAI